MSTSGLGKLNAYLKNLQASGEADTPIVRWSVFTIALISLWLWVIVPLQDWQQSLKEQVEQNAKKAVRLDSLKQQADKWQDAELLALAEMEKQMQALFIESSDTSSQARLQELLSKQCAVRNIAIESLKLVEAEDYPGLGRKLSVAMNLRGELEDVLRFMSDLSHAHHIVQIERWLIRKDRKQTAVAQIAISGFRAVAIETPDAQ